MTAVDVTDWELRPLAAAQTQVAVARSLPRGRAALAMPVVAAETWPGGAAEAAATRHKDLVAQLDVSEAVAVLEPALARAADRLARLVATVRVTQLSELAGDLADLDDHGTSSAATTLAHEIDADLGVALAQVVDRPTTTGLVQGGANGVTADRLGRPRRRSSPAPHRHRPRGARRGRPRVVEQPHAERAGRRRSAATRGRRTRRRASGLGARQCQLDPPRPREADLTRQVAALLPARTGVTSRRSWRPGRRLTIGPRRRNPASRTSRPSRSSWRKSALLGRCSASGTANRAICWRPT